VDWVLGGFGPDQRKQLPEFLADGADAAETVIVDGLNAAQEHFNGRCSNSRCMRQVIASAGRTKYSGMDRVVADSTTKNAAAAQQHQPAEGTKAAAVSFPITSR
jgi:hypothetical protein